MNGEAFGPDELRRIRSQLPAVADVAYLNAGMLGPLPRAGIEAMASEQAYDVERRQDAAHWDRLGSIQAAARGELARLTGVEPSRVALMHSTHEGINSCVWGLGLEPGDNVLTTDEEHPGLLVPLRHARARVGIDVRRFEWCDDDTRFVERARAAVDGRTRAVVLSHVSWASGRIAPLRQLRDALPPHVRIVVDGAQAAGVLPVSTADGWDAYTVSGQKWTCAPNGTGALALLDPSAWQPTFGAYMHVTSWEDVLAADLVDDARRLETSQEALVPLVGVAASVRWLLDEVGVERAAAHASMLNAVARDRLRTAGVDGARIHGDAHLFFVETRGQQAMEIANELVARGFLVRAVGPERVRLSLGCWNSPDEVVRCVDALVELDAAN